MQIKQVVALLLLQGIASSANTACAGLSRAPPSFIIRAQTETHIFVMLSGVPLADDEGDQCALPNGEIVSLRGTFPFSGLYQVGSIVPIWTVDWYGEHRLVRLSDDARYVVLINRFGGGGDRFHSSPSWGIRFFDQGKQIANYDVQDLVDFPSLMPFTMPTTTHFGLIESYSTP